MTPEEVGERMVALLANDAGAGPAVAEGGGALPRAAGLLPRVPRLLPRCTAATPACWLECRVAAGPRAGRRRRAGGALAGRGLRRPATTASWAATSSTGSPPSTSWPTASTVVAHLWSTRRRHGVLLRTRVPRATPTVTSVVDLFPGRGLARAGDARDVRHRLRRPPGADAAAAAARVRGASAAQGVRARLPGGEAVAGREGAGRVRGRRRPARADAPARACPTRASGVWCRPRPAR